MKGVEYKQFLKVFDRMPCSFLMDRAMKEMEHHDSLNAWVMLLLLLYIYFYLISGIPLQA